MMDLNLTLLGQMITFAIFIWFTMKFVWPPITKAMEERRKKIADGLAAAEKGKLDLELAQLKAKEQIDEAKGKAAQIIEQANQRASHIVEEAKSKAREEGDRLLAMAKTEIEQEAFAAREVLMKEVSSLAIAGASKVIQKNLDTAANEQLVQHFIQNELSHG